MKKYKNNTVKTLAGAMLASMVIQQGQAGSFSLYTESAGYTIGNFAAGSAAEAADASIGWFNPAGLSYIHKPELVASGVGVFISSSISGQSTFSVPSLSPYVQSFSGLDGGKDGLVPSLHLAYPLGENATFGLSLVAPFGLMTGWSGTSPVRYAATDSSLRTVNLSPEIGGRITEHFALGAGLDFQYAHVEFNQIIGAPNVIEEVGSLFGADLPPNFLDSLSDNRGNAFDIGFHAGVLFNFNDNHTRVGLNYQSRMGHIFRGRSRLVGPLADPNFAIFALSPAVYANVNTQAIFESTDLSSNRIILPDITTLSFYQDVNERLALLGSLVYIGWANFQNITLNNVAAYNASIANETGSGIGQPALIDANSIEDYKNTWRVALGANYWINDTLMLRLGTGYDQTPTQIPYRSIRVPDSNRWAASIGLHYQGWSCVSFDLGYTHLFAESETLNRTDVLSPPNTPPSAISTFNVNANSNANVNLVGLQVNWLMS